MRRFPLFVVFLALFVVLLGRSCREPAWDEHFHGYDEVVNMKLWDAVKEEPRFSTFVEYIEEYGLDSLFEKEVSHTLFIPDNDAFSLLEDTTGSMERILYYHIAGSVFLTRDVDDKRKLENLTGKFPWIEHTDQGYSYDMIPIEFSSPLYLDGVYYEIAEVAIPRPNLYEFAERYSPAIKTFIDLNDSVFLDKDQSTPIGFDSLGNTVYDSVFAVINLFERDYFPVGTEFRDRTATFVLFTQEQYNRALDDMADALGTAFTDHEDIPDTWQFEVLLPAAMENSLFEGELDYSEFTSKMTSITGKAVTVEPANIDPDSRYTCSNGVTFTYLDFSIPSDLYVGESFIEGEEMVDSIGFGSYSWNDLAEVWGGIFQPSRDQSVDASGGYFTNVTFPRNYSGAWGIRFTFKNVFPMKYRLEWRASYRPSGSYAVSVNDQVLTYQDKFGREQEAFDTYELRQSVVSVTGERFLPEGVFNKRDYWVENLDEYGDVEITIEYKGPGSQESNGFNLDYVALIPAEI